MPPKEVRSAAAAKKPATTTSMTLPVLRPPSNFSVNSTDKFAIAYSCKGTQDYARGPVASSRKKFFFSGGMPKFLRLLKDKKNRQTTNKERLFF
jgi:hypothetical protein